MPDQDQQRQQLIEQYLNGQMNAEEIANFKARLQTDEELAKAYALEETARLVIETSGRAELRNRLETYESAFEKKSAPPKQIEPRRRAWWAIAATLLALIALSIWLLQPGAAESQDLFAANFEVYRAPAPLRGGTEQNAWQQASEAYAAANYVQAAKGFQASLQDSAAIPYLSQFYLGLSLLAQQPPRAEAALSAFETTLLSDHDYRQQAMWYQALALIKLERKQEAKNVLVDLAEMGGFKKAEVEELLRALD